MTLVQIEFCLLMAAGEFSVHAERMWSISTGETAQRIGVGLLYEVPKLQCANLRPCGIGSVYVDLSSCCVKICLTRPHVCIHCAEVRERVGVVPLIWGPLDIRTR